MVDAQLRRPARGTRAFRRLNLAMFAAGLATFALLYAPQPLLPQLSEEYGLSPTEASLAVSVATGALALAVIPLAAICEVVGRARVMTIGVAVAAVLGVTLAVVPGYPAMLIVRAVQGAAVAGLPAAAMAHVAEEVEHGSVGLAMGIYIAGNSIGGMAGRLLVGALTDVAGWRWALASVGLAAAGCAALFAKLLPPTVAFRPQPADVGTLARNLGRHLTDPVLLRLYCAAIVLMGGFVTVYNYLGFRLLRPPFELSPSLVGLIFVCYLAGTGSSALAGRACDAVGRRTVFAAGAVIGLGGLALGLSTHVASVVLGLAVFTFGFFACHSVASGWVGRRARSATAQASSLYILCYYVGSSVGGAFGGVVYSAAGWIGISAYVGALFVVGLLAGQIRR